MYYDSNSSTDIVFYQQKVIKCSKYYENIFLLLIEIKRNEFNFLLCLNSDDILFMLSESNIYAVRNCFLTLQINPLVYLKKARSECTHTTTQHNTTQHNTIPVNKVLIRWIIVASWFSR